MSGQVGGFSPSGRQVATQRRRDTGALLPGGDRPPARPTPVPAPAPAAQLRGWTGGPCLACRVSASQRRKRTKVTHQTGHPPRLQGKRQRSPPGQGLHESQNHNFHALPHWSLCPPPPPCLLPFTPHFSSLLSSSPHPVYSFLPPARLASSFPHPQTTPRRIKYSRPKRFVTSSFPVTEPRVTRADSQVSCCPCSSYTFSC